MQPRTTPEASTPEKIATSLKSVRVRFGKILENRFPPYINNNFLWKDQSRHMAKPVEESDPALVQACKHSLLLLEDAERIAHIFQEYTNRSLARKIISTPRTLYNAHRIYKHDFKVHLDALTNISKNVDLPKSMRDSIDVITRTFTGLNFDELRAGTIPVGAKQVSNNLDKEFLNLMDTYVELQRPSSPKTPEKKYKTSEEKKPEDKSPEMIRLLKPATVLLEPINTGLLFAAKIHNRLNIIIHEEKSRGVYTEDEIKYIEKTTLALQKPIINNKGYISLKPQEGVEETRLSEALKAGFNLVWSINQICTNPDPGVLTYVGAVNAAKPYLDKLKKLILETEDMSDNMKALYEVSIKAMLSECRDLIFPMIKELVNRTHDFELENHLRYGAILDEIRPVFDFIEASFIEWGVPVTNPLGIADSEENVITKKFDAVKSHYDKSHTEKARAKFIGDQLKHAMNNEAVDKGKLIKHLDAFKKSPEIEESDRIAIDVIQDNFIAKLNVQERKSLFDDLNNQPEHDEKLIRKLQAQRDTKPTTTPTKEFKKIAALAVEKEKKIEKPHAANTLAMQSVAYEKREREKIRLEFFMRTFATQGINYFLRATQAALDEKHAKVNLGQKRTLARLLADYENKEAITYLGKAHETATDFLKHPERMKQMALDIFSGKVITNNPQLGHELAMELTLAGYINPNDWGDITILTATNPNLIRKDLVNAMTRLESNQVIDLFKSATDGNPDALKRLRLFNLLISGEPLTADKINAVFSEPAPAPSMTSWVNLFIARYQTLANEMTRKEKELTDKSNLNTWRLQQPERRLMNAIGLFLGRIAHTSEQTAKIVFEKGADIIKNECLIEISVLFAKQDTSDLLQIDVVRSDKALYYESLVLTLPLELSPADRTFEKLVEKNQSLVLSMYRTINPEHKELNNPSPLEVIDFYKTHSWLLAQMTERFIKTCLSSGSQAETQLRDFFSAIALESPVIRQEMFNVFQRMRRSTRAPYIELLSTTSSSLFWEKLQADIVSKANTYVIESKSIFNEMNPFLNTLPEAARKNFAEVITLFVTQQNEELKNTFTELKEAKKDVLLACYYTQQKTETVADSIKKQKAIWAKEILQTMIAEFKNSLIKEKAEHVKKMTRLMESKTTKEFRQQLTAKMDSYHPETALDKTFSSLTFISLNDAEKAMGALTKQKADIQASTIKQFETWSNEAALNIAIHADIKLMRPFVKNINTMKDAFKDPDKFWEDAGKFYVATESMRSGELKRPESKNPSQTGLELIRTRLQQQVKKLIANKRPDLIESLIRHFPEQKTTNILTNQLEFSQISINILMSLNGLQALLASLPAVDEEFKKSITTDINTCFIKQNELANYQIEAKVDQRTAQTHTANILGNLKSNITKMTKDIVQHHCTHLQKKLVDHFTELKQELLKQMDGRINSEFQKKMIDNINNIDPTKQADNLLLTYKPVTLEVSKEAIPVLTTYARQQTESIDQQFRTWSAEIEKQTKVVRADVFEFREALRLITKALSDYLETQGRFAFVYSALDLPLRGQKMGIASECLSKLKTLDEKIDSHPDQLSECSQELFENIDTLDKKHKVMIKNSKDKSGTLDLTIKKIKDLEEPIQRRQQQVQRQSGTLDMKMQQPPTKS